jgi:putative CRISPR-associated protein (TIGR02619 family)
METAVHVVMVGVSILRNAVKSGAVSQAEYTSLTAAGALDEGVAEEMRVRLRQFVVSQPFAASAELAAMEPYFKAGRVAGTYLVVTDTPEGRIAAEALEVGLRERFHVEVAGRTTIAGPREVGEGDPPRSMVRLWQLLHLVISQLKIAGQRVAVNATGGLKPHVAISIMVGHAAGVPVYYRHELSGQTVLVPLVAWALCPAEIRKALLEISRYGRYPVGVESLGEDILGSLVHLELAEIQQGAAGESFVVLSDRARLLLELADVDGKNWSKRA